MALSPFFTKATFTRALIGSILEFGPIIIFLASFHYLHIYKATFILMIVTIISTVLSYRLHKRLPYLALYIAFLTTVFGYLTLAYHQPRFIQVRDTIYDITTATTLIVGLLFNTSFLKAAFQSIIPQTDRAWKKITIAWIGFFLMNACLNEYVRRTYSLGDWFDFKSAMVFITIFFGLTVLISFYEKAQNK